MASKASFVHHFRRENSKYVGKYFWWCPNIVDRIVLYFPWFSMVIFSSLNTLCNRSNEFWADDNGLVIKFGISLKTTQVDFMAVLHSIFWSSNDIAADQKFFGI